MSAVIEPASSASPEPRFGRWMGAMWLYTLLRIGLFLALWGLAWLFGASGLIGAVVAVVLSIPLSYVLLAKPRAAFAAQIEQRLESQRAARARLSEELDPGNRRDEDDDLH